MNRIFSSNLPFYKKKIGILFIIWLLPAGMLLSARQLLATPENAALNIVPSQTPIGPDENVTITVTLTTLDAEPFGTWKVHLDYDNTVLQLDSLVPNENVVPMALPASTNGTMPGSIVVVDGAFSNNSGSSTPYILLTATFTTLVEGSSNFLVITDTIPQNETNYGDVLAGNYWIPGTINVQDVDVISAPTAITLSTVSVIPSVSRHILTILLATCLLLIIIHLILRHKKSTDF